MFSHPHVVGLLSLSLALFGVSSARAEEGMWLFNQLPLEQLKRKYSFEPSSQWLDRVMKASVRFSSGGSGSFISSTGLVLTNHHVAADTLDKISSPSKNYYQDGFYAAQLVDEIRAPDLELRQLVSIEDVTARVQGAVKPGMSAGDELKAKRAEMARIEKESTESTGLQSDVVTLYQGGQYHLYRYKKYTDIRLVFAPEFGVAFFGGDPDNFEYPRYDLDMAIFRVYEDGKPVQTPDFLPWSQKGAQEGELVFVSGHPGRTERMLTVAALRALRDGSIPATLDSLVRKESFLKQYSYLGAEQARQAEGYLFGVQNSRKVYEGQLKGLQDPALMRAKIKNENELKVKVAENPQYQSSLDAWDRVSKAEAERLRLLYPYTYLERGAAVDSTLFWIARTLWRMAEEDAKPEGERLPEFRESTRASLLRQVFSPAPLYREFEIAKVAFSLQLAAEKLGYEHPIIQRILEGRSPEDRARELIEGTALVSVAVRKRLAAGGTEAMRLATQDDQMIRMVAEIDSACRALRKEYDDKVDGVRQKAYGEISKAVFALYGTSVYPDATFTLRLSYGAVQGYQQNGAHVPPFTTLGGAFEHQAKHRNEKPWVLPESWHQNKAAMNLSTPYNFVSTNDIIGGNSGSPVLNAKGELVGLIFDGNIQSLVGNYVYDISVNRAVSVHSAGMLEAMRKIYHADGLVNELLGANLVGPVLR